ncbi:MAG: HNH endonuclease [Thermoproteota archaeon]
MKKLKLTIELVPSTVWFSSLYRLTTKEKWEALKNQVYQEEGRKCYICGSERGPFELHEFWEYDEKEHQKLVGVHNLCKLCHMVKHIGYWCYTHEGEEKMKKLGITRKTLMEHFCKVNGCAERDFEKHEEEAFETWRKRSKYEWKQDFGKYKEILGLTKG